MVLVLYIFKEIFASNKEITVKKPSIKEGCFGFYLYDRLMLANESAADSLKASQMLLVSAEFLNYTLNPALGRAKPDRKLQNILSLKENIEQLYEDLPTLLTDNSLMQKSQKSIEELILNLKFLLKQRNTPTFLVKYLLNFSKLLVSFASFQDETFKTFEFRNRFRYLLFLCAQECKEISKVEVIDYYACAQNLISQIESENHFFELITVYFRDIRHMFSYFSDSDDPTLLTLFQSLIQHRFMEQIRKQKKLTEQAKYLRAQLDGVTSHRSLHYRRGIIRKHMEQIQLSEAQMKLLQIVFLNILQK